MAAFTQASKLNIDSIRLIQNGYMREAVALLDSSWEALTSLLPTELATIHEAHKDADDDYDGDDDGRCTVAHIVTFRSVAVGDFLSASPVQNFDWNRPAEPDHSFFTIYNRAFAFDNLPRLTRTEFLHFAANIPIAMFFNEGLAYHILALREGSSGMLNAALVYYIQSYQMIEDESSLGALNGDTDLVYMALVNNMGHCFARLNETDEMMWCYNQLYSMFASSKQKQRLTLQERQFFEERIHLGIENLRRPAPAA